jgi:hypothetical protein
MSQTDAIDDDADEAQDVDFAEFISLSPCGSQACPCGGSNIHVTLHDAKGRPFAAGTLDEAAALEFAGDLASLIRRAAANAPRN